MNLEPFWKFVNPNHDPEKKMTPGAWVGVAISLGIPIAMGIAILMQEARLKREWFDELQRDKEVEVDRADARQIALPLEQVREQSLSEVHSHREQKQ